MNFHARPARRRARRGMLTLEWILLITVVVIGIIGGLGAVRNALLGELHDLAECIESLNICDDDDSGGGGDPGGDGGGGSS